MKKSLFCFSLLFFAMLSGTEYFVSPRGSDKNSGTSEKTPLRKISTAVSKLKAGDIVTILPGEYLDEISFVFNGDFSKPTIIRARIPGTVHMRGDIPAPRFEAVAGRKNVYVCKVDRMPEFVLERDTLKKFRKVPSIAETESTPGSSFFDVENKKIYIQCSDRMAPEFHRITFSVLKGDALRIRSAKLKNFHVSGLIFSGYNSGSRKVGAASTFGGIYMQNPHKCSIKDCIAYLSGSGISIYNVVDSVVENCLLFCNENEFNGSGGNIVCYGPGKNSVQRKIISFGSGMAGQRFYSGAIFDNCLIEDCISFDNKYGDIWIKYPSATSWVKRCFASNSIHSRFIKNSIFTSGDTYYDGMAQLSICRSREKKFDPHREFADPAHFDYHLQEDSVFRNRKGGDWGIKGFSEKVLFVSAAGNDAFSGNSMRKPLKTLRKAGAKLQNGGSLYLSGNFKEKLILRNLKDIIIRGRGVFPAVLSGGIRLENCSNVHLENINVMGTGSFSACKKMTIKRCAFVQKTAIPDDSQVRHCLFIGDVTGGKGGFFRGNLFCGAFTGTPLFSGWNAYVKNSIPESDIAPTKVPAPLFSNFAKGDLTLKNHYQYAGICADGFPFGQYRYDYVLPQGKIELRQGAVSSTSATFIVRSAADSRARITFKSSDGKRYSSADGYGSEYAVSFTGLKPGSSYKGKAYIYSSRIKLITNAPASRSKETVCAFSFSTPAKDTPRTLYVSPSGDNANDGSSWAKAIAGIGAAVERARAGDTVLVGSGSYKETVRIFSTGDKGKWLTIAGAPGSEVDIDGCRNLHQGIFLRGKHYIKLDNMRICNNFGNGSLSDPGGIVCQNGSNIIFSRIFYDNRSSNGQYSFNSYRTEKLLVENCVGVTSFSGMGFTKCPALEIRNCVFVRNKVSHGYIGTDMNSQAHLHHCIFAGHVLQKVHNPCLNIGEASTFKEHDNGFLVRVDRKEKPLWGFRNLNGTALPQNDAGFILNSQWMRQGRFGRTILTYDDYCKQFKVKPTALFGDPQMKAVSYFYKFKDLQDWHDNYIQGKASAAQKELFRKSNTEELRAKDRIVITDYIARNPEFLKRGIGLDPKAFKK